MNAITKHAAVVPAGLRPQSFAELERFAAMAAKSSMVPKDYINRPENVMVAIQMGSELGLAPLQSLQNISVINGRPAIWGDAMIGLCRASPACEDVIETIDGDGDALTATCIAKRRGSTPTTSRFSVADAKRAGLWNKGGPWQQYPNRMLQLRARGFALRDAFPDLLRGLISAEEARDIPPDNFSGQTIEAKAEPTRVKPMLHATTEPQDERMAKLAPTYDTPQPDDDAPQYPFATKKGGRILGTGSEWLDIWRRTVEACVRTEALDKLAEAAAMNAAPIAAIAEFDPQAAEEVRAMLAAALPPEEAQP
jgi:hypothetical protein